jgi:ketosteroid isomerase-like protein
MAKMTLMLATLAAGLAAAGAASGADDRAIVSAMDVQYQAAVKANDAATMDRILHPDFVLVIGSGAVVSREALLDSARKRAVVYEIQDEAPGSQTVRVYGDTAVVTAKLRIKYTADGKVSDRTLWFSDTYVRTKTGWRYAFGQASSPLAEA